MRDILKRNNQVQHGENNELITRITDGETYGQLPKCPTCFKGQLRLDVSNPEMVICSGCETIVKNEKFKSPRGYKVNAINQVRTKRWIGQKYFIYF